MTTWILSDPHGGADEPTDRSLLALLSRAEGRADLLILGDLFVAWLGPTRFHTSAQRQVLDAIRRVRASGQSVRFIVGNRDYLVDERSSADVFDHVYEGETLLKIDDVPTLVCHGDGIVREDWAYRAWRRISRGRTVSRALERVPGAVGRALASGAAQALAPLNRGFKTGALPLSAIEALGRRAFRKGAVRALVGHFHHGRTISVPGGAPVQIAPSWMDYRQVLVPRGGELTPTALAGL